MADILGAVSAEATSVLGYPHAWLFLVGDKPGYMTMVSMASEHAQAHVEQLHELKIAGDAMLEEIAEAEHIVVVADARTDPRTNKEIVAAMGNRTIINVPLILAETRLGTLGMGTFGDTEGVRAPDQWHLDYMTAMAGHVAVALDRVHFMAAQKRAEAALYQEKERLQVTLHSIGDAVITTDADGRIEYLNPIAEALTGWSLVEALGRPLGDVFHPVDEYTGEPVADPVAICLAEGRGVTLAPHSMLANRQGHHLAIEDSAAPIRDANGNVLGAVLVFHDVTEQRRLAREIAYQASHDELTGLANRREFEQRLDHAIGLAQRDRTEHVLCYLDLDDFKVVNDTCGHTAGDELLRQLAALFRGSIRLHDTLSRLGGDEFGLLLEDCDISHALHIADSLQQRLAEYRFVWKDKSFRVGVSIGVVPVTQHTESVGAALQAADTACYVAKEAGHNRIHLYAPHDPALAQRYGVMEWVSRIERALDEDRFQLHGQRIAPLRIPASPGLHCELLLRLTDEVGNLALPGAFMPAVERYHLAPRVDRWVVRHAFRWLAAHAGQVDVCSINLSGSTLGDPSFLSDIQRELDAFALPTEKVCFEITETATIANLADATRFIRAMKDLGCRFALDDFGSGLSSFAYLKHLPVDYLKIDGLFVRDIDTDPINLALVKSIHEVGCVMGKQTVAEYVESPQILGRLEGLGVHYAQGYAVGRPVPLDTLLQA